MILIFRKLLFLLLTFANVNISSLKTVEFSTVILLIYLLVKYKIALFKFNQQLKKYQNMI